MRTRPQIISVNGGKGGSGKSLIAVQLSIYLAKQGKRVLLIDASPSGGNLQYFFGLDGPEHTLDEWLKRGFSLVELTLGSPIDNLSLIAGFRELSPLFIRESLSVQNFCRELIQIDQELADTIIVDAGSGSSLWSVSIAVCSDKVLLVTTPDPQDISSQYFFLRQMAFLLVRRVVEPRFSPPPDWLPRIWGLQLPPSEGRIVLEQLSKKHLYSLLNFTLVPSDAQIVKDLSLICSLFFGFPTYSLGSIPFDEEIQSSVRNRQPFLDAHPISELSKRIQANFAKLTRTPRPIPAPLLPVEEPYLQIAQELGMIKDKSLKELNDTYVEIMKMFNIISPSTSGLFSPKERYRFLDIVGRWNLDCQNKNTSELEKQKIEQQNLSESKKPNNLSSKLREVFTKKKRSSNKKMSEQVKEIVAKYKEKGN